MTSGITIVDAHCHLDEIPDYVPEKNVLPIPCGHSHSSNLKIVEIAKKFHLPFALGISPQAAQKEDLAKWNDWVAFIRAAKPNGIGEIGLDFHWAQTPEQKEKQYFVFQKMLDLADELRLPVVLHCREAGDEILKILHDRKTQNPPPKTHDPKPSAMWHFFSGTEVQAQKALDMGMFLSFPPLPSRARERAIRLAPLDKILAETDAPVGARLPSGVVQSIEYIAQIKNLDFEEVARQTAKNAMRLFNFKGSSPRLGS